MAKDNSSYKDSLKATSLFGGVQIYSILIQIARSKFVALLLGPAGMGVSGLLVSATTLIGSLTNFGLSGSAVRNISAAVGSEDKEKVLGVIAVFRKLVWGTGLIGLMTCLFLSPYLSQWTFGNKDYTVAFAMLSVTLLFQQLTSGQTAILQSLRKYRYMAKSNMIGNTIGLIITVPLYYLWGINAIVPVMILTSLFSLLLSIYFYKKLNIEKRPINKELMRTDGLNMVFMGFTLSLSMILETIVAYIIRIFISNKGGLADVGLYAAGFTIVSTYVGMVFTAMGTDYYPRLSSVNTDKDKFNELINNQIEIAILILAPILCVFLIFIEFAITIFYSSKFLPIAGLMYFAVFATSFKAVSFCVGYSFGAKGDFKAFMQNELVAQIYFITSQLLGYYYWGLTGIGFAYLFNYLIYLFQVIFICTWRYGFSLRLSSIIIFMKQIMLIAICLVLVLTVSNLLKYIAGIFFIILSIAYSYREMDKNMDIRQVLNKFIGSR